jgi:uncharacterized repeat protein (TIGR02543 family)
MLTFMEQNLAKFSRVGLALATVVFQLFAMFQISSPANAVTSYTLTIVASGGSNENTNWSYNAGTGEISISASVSINASDIVTKLSSAPLVVNADTISVTSSVVNPTSNSLTLKSTGNINLSGGVVLESQGGNITLQSNSDSLTNGSIRLGSHTDTNVGRITTNGGNITLSGGSNPATDFAVSAADLSTGKPAAGVAIYGFQISAAGGNVLIRGSSWAVNFGSHRAVLIEKNAASTNNGWAKIETTGLGSIDIYGDASLRTGGTAWGPTISSTTFSTVSGDINIKGKGAISGSNGRGVAIGGPATFTSTSGNFNIWDETNSANTSSGNYNGLYLDNSISLQTAGSISVKSDKIAAVGSLTLESPSVVIEPNSTSFTAAVTLINITASNCQSLQIGKAGSTGNITIGTSALTVGGPIAIYGNNITLSKAITATSSTVSLFASGTVTQAEPITATNLRLSGSGTFSLQNGSNNVANLIVEPGAGGLSFSGSNTVSTITYDANGATGGSIPPSTTGFGSVSLASNSNSLVKSGYTFEGWNTDQFGTGTSYAVGGSYTLSSDVTIYAKWIEIVSNSSSSSSSSSTPTPSPTPTSSAKVKPKSNTRLINPQVINNPLTPNPVLPSNIVAGTPVNPRELVKSATGRIISPLKPVVIDLFKLPTSNAAAAADLFTNQSALELILNTDDKKVVDLPSLVLFDNKVQESKVIIVENTVAQIVIPTGGALNVEAKVGQNPVPVNTRGRVQMVRNNDVQTEGTGLAPNSEFAVYLFSEPTLLGVGKTNANGEFFAKFLVEKALPIGDHTLQINGLLPDGGKSSVSMPVTIVDTIATAQSQAMPKTILVKENPLEKAINNLYFLIAILVALAAFMVVASSRLFFANVRKNSKKR